MEIKRTLALMLPALIISGCAASGNDSVFRDKIVPDFESVLKYEEEIFSAYEDAAEAAKAFAENPTEENKGKFIDAANKSSAAIKDNPAPSSSLSEKEYGAMEELNLSEADYRYLFESCPSGMAGLDDWDDVTDRLDAAEDYETLRHSISIRETKLELERVYMAYASMEWVVNTEEDNIKYFEETLRKYPSVMPEEYEWLTNEDEIINTLDEKMSAIQDKINEEQIYSNDVMNRMKEEGAE